MNNHNRYCKQCYAKTDYLHHIDGTAWYLCKNCDKAFHLHATIGDRKFYKILSNIRDKKLNKILK